MKLLLFSSCLLAFAALALPLSAQTLYVPGGTLGNISGSNVGIGTASPSQKLTVAGNINKPGSWIVGDFAWGANTFEIHSSSWDGASNGAYGGFAAGHGYFYGGLQSGGPSGGEAGNGQLYVSGTSMLLGGVGVGTTSPGTTLDVQGAGGSIRVYGTATNDTPQIQLRNANQIWQWIVDGSDSNKLKLRDGGANAAVTVDASRNVGIGTMVPGRWGSLLQVQADQNSTTRTIVENDNSGGSSAAEFVVTAYGNSWAMGMGSMANNSNAFYIGKDVATGTPTAKYLSIATDGKVGIGTTSPTQKLSVNGTIQAKEVIVQAGWSDFVFDAGYKLKALSEVEAYVKAEKHLPGIPSAQDVAEHGVTLGEMQSKLLAKIEELTLHQIEQEKRQSAQQEQISAQADRIQKLEAENAALRFTRQPQ